MGLASAEATATAASSPAASGDVLSSDAGQTNDNFPRLNTRQTKRWQSLFLEINRATKFHVTDIKYKEDNHLLVSSSTNAP